MRKLSKAKRTLAVGAALAVVMLAGLVVAVTGQVAPKPANAVAASFYKFEPVFLPGHVIDMPRDSRDLRTQFHVYKNLPDHKNQEFYVQDANIPGYPTAKKLVLRSSGMCMDVKGASEFIYAPIIQYTCTGQTHQAFFLDNASEYGTGYVRIRAFHSAKCVDVAGWTSSSLLQQYHCNTANNSHHVFKQLPYFQ